MAFGDKRPNGCVMFCNWCSAICTFLAATACLISTFPYAITVYNISTSGDDYSVVTQLRYREWCSNSDTFGNDQECFNLETKYGESTGNHYESEMKHVRIVAMVVTSLSLLMLLTAVTVSCASKKSSAGAQVMHGIFSFLGMCLGGYAANAFINSDVYQEFVDESNYCISLFCDSFGFVSVFTIVIGAAGGFCFWSFVASVSWPLCCNNRSHSPSTSGQTLLVVASPQYAQAQPVYAPQQPGYPGQPAYAGQPTQAYPPQQRQAYPQPPQQHAQPHPSTNPYAQGTYTTNPIHPSEKTF